MRLFPNFDFDADFQHFEWQNKGKKMALSDVNVRVGADIKQFSTAMQNAAKKLDAIGKKMQDTGKNMSTYLTAPLAGLAAVSVAAFDKQAQAQAKLSSALAMAGENVQESMKDFQQFASNLQDITTVGDESTLALLQTSKAMGLSNEQAKNAAKNAIAMAKSMGMSETAAIRYTSALEQGDATMLTRYIPTLKSITDPAEKAAKAQEMLAKMFGAATAEAQTGLGPLTQLKNSFGDLLEQFGAIIAEGLIPITNALKHAVKWMQGLSDRTKKIIVIVGGLLAAIGPVLFILGSVIKVLPVVIAGFKALAAVWTILTAKITLIILAIAALAAGIYYVWDNWEAVTQNLKNIVGTFVNFVIEKFGGMYKWVAKGARALGLDSLASALDQVGDKIQSWQQPVTQVTAKFKGFGETISDIKGKLADALSFDSTPIETAATNFKSMAAGAGKAALEVKKLGASLGLVSGGQSAGSTMSFAATPTSSLTEGQMGIGQLDKLTEAYRKGIISVAEAQREFIEIIGQAPIQEGIDKIRAAAETAINLAEQVRATVEGAVEGAITGMAEGIGNAIAGAGSIQDVFKGLLMAVLDFGSQLGKILIAHGVAVKALKAVSIAPGVAIVAGAALVAAAAAGKALLNKGPQIPALAEGGLSFAPTLAMVGDNRNARVDPEVIAPLSKLQGIMGNSGGSGYIAETRISGQDLRILLKKADNDAGRIG